MKQLIAIFAFLILSFNGFCDTIDYFHVYINNKCVAQLNAFSEDLLVEIKKTELKNDDIITVRYGTDHPCPDCEYVLTTIAEVKRKLPEAKTKEHFGKLSIQAKDLLEIVNEEGINKFGFNYFEERRVDGLVKREGGYIFTLVIN